jgi:hypothetical protein
MISPLVQQARKIYVAKPLGLVSFCPNFQPRAGSSALCLVWELPALDVQERACPVFENADRLVIVALDGRTRGHPEAPLREQDFGNIIPGKSV